MDGQEQRTQEEVAALWRELFGEPPPVRADAAMMLDAIMAALPAKSYDRLVSPHLRSSQVSRPRVPAA